MEPFTLPIPKFSEYSGLGETKTRELITLGELESVVAAGRRLVIISSYHRYIEREKAKPPQDARRNKAGAIPALGERGERGRGRRSRQRPNSMAVA